MVMSGPVRVAAIIPAYDAARTLGAVARETVQSFEGIGTVYVVNDGSRDDTGEIARSAGATVLTHAKNAGKVARSAPASRAPRPTGTPRR